MRRFAILAAFAAILLLGAQNASAQCCDDPDGTGPDTPSCLSPVGPDPGEGCTDLGGGTCIGGDAIEGGAGPTGCLCVAGTCICDASGGPCPSASACADAADNACES